MRQLALAIVLGLALGCGSPEKYAKQDGADSTSLDATIGIRLDSADAPWARELGLAMETAASEFERGDTLRGLFMLDSLIRYAEPALDTIPFDDVRRKYLVLMLADLYGQAIAVEDLRGNNDGVRIRTERFQLLAQRIKLDKAANSPDSQ